MATKALLAELAGAYEAHAGHEVAIESVGGVDAARRVRAGEPFDFVVLGGDSIDGLLAEGHLVAGSRVDLAISPVAVAVRAGADRPDIAGEDALRRCVLAAPSIGISTGPSGVALGRLFERWGVAPELRARTVTPPPGLPVGSLIARGEVALGFQQLSELVHLEGVDVLGPMPDSVRIVTTFSGAIGARSRRPAAARKLLDFLASPAAAAAKRRQGMDPPDASAPFRDLGP